MNLTLSKAIEEAKRCEVFSSIPLTEEQNRLLHLLNLFAIHQAQYNPEVRQIPAKLIYKVNDELKLALVAILTTCSLLDPRRHGEEAQKFFEDQISILQEDNGNKLIRFGKIRPQLVRQSLIPEIVDDWTFYRDVNGDGIHALMDRKTSLQGLATYQRGGSPVYEFARFYRRFMEDKLAKQQQSQERAKEIALKSLTDQIVQKQLESGYSAPELMQNLIQNGSQALFYSDELQDEANIPAPKRLTNK